MRRRRRPERPTLDRGSEPVGFSLRIRLGGDGIAERGQVARPDRLALRRRLPQQSADLSFEADAAVDAVPLEIEEPRMLAFRPCPPWAAAVLPESAVPMPLPLLRADRVVCHHRPPPLMACGRIL